MKKKHHAKSSDESKGLEGLADKFVHRVPLPWLIAIAVIALGFVLLLVKAPPAKAQEACWRTFCNQSRTHCYPRQVPCYRPRVYAYERRWDDDEDRRSGRNCREVRKAVGDQHLTVDGAKKAANDQWAALVRFHLGEKFIDLNNARHLVYTCSRSSIKEQGTSVTTLGQALTRCELQAVPCEPLPEHERREER